MINIAASVWDIGVSKQAPAGQAYLFNGDSFEPLVLPMLDKLTTPNLANQASGSRQAKLSPPTRS